MMELAHTPRILVIDDDEILRLLIKTLLGRQNYELMMAQSGEEGLQTLAENSDHIDVILLDIMMPGLDGFAVLKRIKQDPKTANIKVIMLTAVNAVEEKVKTLAGGADDYVVKPFQREELVARIETQIRLKQAEDLAEAQNLQLKEWNDTLEQKVRARTQEIEDKNRALERSFFDTVTMLAGLISVRDHFSGGHAERVSHQATNLAELVGLSPAEIRDCRVAALLHDIGIIGLPRTLIHKNELYMTEKEQEEYRKHTLIGQACLQVVESMAGVALIVRHHHECFDGSGYPDGLGGQGIPIGARIIALVTDYDLFLHKFWQSKSQTERQDRAIDRLIEGKGKRYDPALVDTFLAGLTHHITDAIVFQEEKIKVTDLEAGMVLAQDLYTTQGVLLATAGLKLTPLQVQKIYQFSQLQPIIDGVQVYMETF